MRRHNLDISFDIDLSRLPQIVNKEVAFSVWLFQMLIWCQVTLDFWNYVTLRISSGLCSLLFILLLNSCLPTSLMLSLHYLRYVQIIVEKHIVGRLNVINLLRLPVLEPYVIAPEFVLFQLAFAALVLSFESSGKVLAADF